MRVCEIELIVSWLGFHKLTYLATKRGHGPHKGIKESHTIIKFPNS